MEHLVGFSLPFGFPGFIGLWCLVCFLFSLISGWKSLATQFQTQNKPAGRHSWTIPIEVPGARSVELIVTNEKLVEEIERYTG